MISRPPSIRLDLPIKLTVEYVTEDEDLVTWVSDGARFGGMESLGGDYTMGFEFPPGCRQSLTVREGLLTQEAKDLFAKDFDPSASPSFIDAWWARLDGSVQDGYRKAARESRSQVKA